jgi:TorA maturation chaperone TorD
MNQFTSTDSTADEMAALAGIYGLLARLWLREVDASLLEELCSPPLCERFEQTGGIIPEKDDANAIEELAIDYCQLFIGPTEHLPPLQSVWQNGQFQGDATASMKEWAEAISYESALPVSATMLDHLGVQLDVMGRILSQLPIAHEKTDRNISPNEIPKTFCRKHLTWPTPLLEVAIERAKSKFYRSMIRMTRDFLKSEQRYWMSSVSSSTP